MQGSQQQQHARLAMPGRVPDGALPMQLSGLHQQLAQDMVKLPSHALHDLDLEDSSSTAWPPLKVPDNALLSTFFVSAEEEQPGARLHLSRRAKDPIWLLFTMLICPLSQSLLAL